MINIINNSITFAGTNLSNLTAWEGIVPNPSHSVDYADIIFNVCKSIDSHIVMLCLLILSFWTAKFVIYPRIEIWLEKKVKDIDDPAINKKWLKIEKNFQRIYDFHDKMALACCLFIAAYYIKLHGYNTPYLWWFIAIGGTVIIIFAWDLMKKIRGKK